MTEQQLTSLKKVLRRTMASSPFYQEKFKGINVENIQSAEDFEALPFSDKGELRNAYPLGLQAVPDEEVIRIHSSSGTT